MGGCYLGRGFAEVWGLLFRVWGLLLKVSWLLLQGLGVATGVWGGISNVAAMLHHAPAMDYVHK